jgi:hypothetical protein
MDYVPPLSNGRLTVADEPAVDRLLRDVPDLAVVIGEAASELTGVMPDVRLSLELLPDSDYGGGDQLFLGVSTSLDEDEALAALRRFDEEWWVHHVGRARGLLCIDLSDA